MTLTLQPGVVVKTIGNAFIVDRGGSLVVNGTASAPVTMTSKHDDSVGGDTDGSAETPEVGHVHRAVQLAGGATFTASNLTVRWATYGVYDFNPSNTNPTHITISDSRFENNDNPLEIGDPGAVLDVKRTAFVDSRGFGASLYYDANPVGLAMAGADTNTWSGTGPARLVRLADARVRPGSSWTVASESGAVLTPRVLYVQGSVTLQPGVVVKTIGNAFIVDRGGSLVVNGTASAPVTMTSKHDDSVGGDTDGSAETPEVGHVHRAVQLAGGATFTASNLTVRWATYGVYDFNPSNTNPTHMTISDSRFENNSTGLLIYDPEAVAVLSGTISDSDTAIEAQYGTVSFRGRIAGIRMGVQACNWGSQACTVDATYVDWGSSRGPLRADGSWLVCGQVAVDQWIDQGPDQLVFGAIPNCDGSPTQTQRLREAQNRKNAYLNKAAADCSAGFRDACDIARLYYECFNAAVDLANQSSPIPVPRDGADVAQEVGEAVVSTGAAFLRDSADQVVESIGRAAGYASKIIKVVELIINIGNAYDRCLGAAP